MTEEACRKYKNADADLNSVYQQILAAKAGEAAFVKALRGAQRAWVAFRDAHVQSIYPDANSTADYGTVYPMCRCVILEELTLQRTKQLRALWVEGVPEGESCAGTSVIKRNNSGPTRKR